MPNRIYKSALRLFRMVMPAWMVMFFCVNAKAFSPEFYASNSVMSAGSWAKIEVKETGMQFISDAMLASLGFANPEAVNVYGYGGRIISEKLDSPDDLPLVESLRVDGGIIFFGHSNESWSLATSSSKTMYSHNTHPYSDNSYYFLSDAEGKQMKPDKLSAISSGSDIIIESFTQRLLHEQDLFMAMDTGRTMLGEDFRTSSTRVFSFPLPGNTGNAVVTTAFGCKATGNSSITISANGKQLTAADADKMNYSATKLIVTTKSVKEVADAGTNLDLTIKFNGGGTVSKAGLDYIEVEYPRSIALTGPELYFYINPSATSEVRLEGAGSTTVVWDVTDPTNPVEVYGTLNGTTLSFKTEPGYKEFVAFEPSKITRSVESAGKIQNQNIHAMEAPGMLVICPPEYMEAANRLEALHAKTDGLTLAILTPEEIYNEFSSGSQDLSAFRKLLKMWYDRAGGQEDAYTRFCVIMSRPTYDNKMLSPAVKNAGYPRIPIYQSPTGETETTSYSTDDYIGMLEDITGTFNIGNAIINVAVGRMPVKSLSEANAAIEKLENFLTEVDYGSWRNNVVVIADDQDSGVHLDQAEKTIEAMQEAGNGSEFLYEKLYLDSYPLEYTGVGASYPAAHERLMNKFSEGIAFLDYIGHANPSGWGHEYLLTWNDINKMNNTRLPFIYAATCEFMRWDSDDVSGAEVMWLLPDAGTIGMICPSREVLISANGVLNRSTAQYLFDRDSNGLPLRFGEIMIKGKNASTTGANKLRYGLMGDPSIRMPWPTMSVKVDSIAGKDINGEEDFPVIKAREAVEVSGHIEDADGNLQEGFNGIAEIQLYDSERVITTNGNGSDGVVSEYNDRKIRLYKGRVKVVDGKWSTTINMPTEIENNYSPALLSLYAYSEEGVEANGSCEKLYVYGYDETAADDYDGPTIHNFYLNTPSFVSGQEVSPSPVVIARFSDESGISVSEAGIGHGLILELDGKTYFEDISQYYVPDENDPTAGSIAYRLTNVDQGKHTLRFVVWDNANNSSSATLEFNISALWKPSIERLSTDVNPATASVNFIVATDAATDAMECLIEVFDINGRKVWSDSSSSFKISSSSVTLGWDLTDYGGARVKPGIYLYKATVTTETGAKVTKTRKLIVA